MNISVTASVFFTIALLLTGCQRHKQTLKAIPAENNELAFITASCSIGSDLPKTKSFVLTVSNPSSRILDEVTIEVNEVYSTPLEDFFIYRGVWKGNQPLGRNRILANEEVVIRSSHDIPNHYVLKNRAGEPMPSSIVPKKITILSKQGKATWTFRE